MVKRYEWSRDMNGQAPNCLGSTKKHEIEKRLALHCLNHASNIPFLASNNYSWCSVKGSLTLSPIHVPDRAQNCENFETSNFHSKC